MFCIFISSFWTLILCTKFRRTNFAFIQVITKESLLAAQVKFLFYFWGFLSTFYLLFEDWIACCFWLWIEGGFKEGNGHVIYKGTQCSNFTNPLPMGCWEIACRACGEWKITLVRLGRCFCCWGWAYRNLCIVVVIYIHVWDMHWGVSGW